MKEKTITKGVTTSYIPCNTYSYSYVIIISVLNMTFVFLMQPCISCMGRSILNLIRKLNVLHPKPLLIHLISKKQQQQQQQKKKKIKSNQIKSSSDHYSLGLLVSSC